MEKGHPSWREVVDFVRIVRLPVELTSTLFLLLPKEET